MLEENIVAKIVGVICGVFLSLVMVAPESTRNAFFRIAVGAIGGIVFVPVTQSLVPIFSGDTFEIVVAASAATGFVIWFVLEFVARLVSSEGTLARLLQEVLRLKGVNVKIDLSDKGEKDGSKETGPGADS